MCEDIASSDDCSAHHEITWCRSEKAGAAIARSGRRIRLSCSIQCPLWLQLVRVEEVLMASGMRVYSCVNIDYLPFAGSDGYRERLVEH